MGISSTNLSVNSKWTKLIIRNIPTHLGEGTTVSNLLAAELKTTLPDITLSWIPRWRTTPESRKGKAFSAMVIAVPGKHSIKSLGITYVNLYNRPCRIKEYLHLCLNPMQELPAVPSPCPTLH